MEMKKYLRTVLILGIMLVCQPAPVLGKEYSEGYRIVINIPRHSLTLFLGENKIKTYPVAVGKPGTATPVGSFSIYNRAVYPVWHPRSKDPVLPGPDNPLGVRWLGFYRGYGIHGNNDPASIGKSVSAGCVRMYNYDVEELYSMADIGVPVKVEYQDLIDIVDEGVLMVYCDVYERQKGFRNSITRELEKTGILDKIPEKKLECLFHALSKKPVVFSDKWVLMVNGEYLTADTIYDRTMIFVNADDLNSFFGICIEWDDRNNTGKLMGRPVSAYKTGDNIYASIADVAGIIGGKLSAVPDIEELNYSINFVKLDGKFLTSGVIDFTTRPGIDASLIGADGEGYVYIDNLDKEGFRYNIFSRKGYIDVFSPGYQG